MSELFLELVNRSIEASWLVLAVLLVRLFLKKAPRWVMPVLWGIVALRLVLPFSIESVLSLIPSGETVSPEIMLSPAPAISSGVPIINSAVNPVLQESFSPNPAASANPLQIWVFILAILWALGLTGMVLYTAITYLCLRLRVKTAVRLRENIWQSERVKSPFVLGLFRPSIYLPFGMEPAPMESVIAHEQAHIRRRDHLIKPFGFLLLAVFWFNPLLWVGYVLLCRDIELACDEKVIQTMDPEQRADYSQTLLACSVSRRSIAACPLAFGEVGVKKRIRFVLNYKKPAFWLILVAVVLCIVLVVCFLTDPQTAKFDFSDQIVTQAQTMDLRGSDPVLRELNQLERGELTSRLRALKVGQKNDDYSGFTPFYSVTVRSEGIGQFYLNGYEATGKFTAIQLEDGYYEINDQAFSKYLSDLCAEKNAEGTPAESTEPIAPLYLLTVIDEGGFWFDYLTDPRSLPDEPLEATAAEFPGVTFRWDYSTICAVTAEGEEQLLTGMPIWNCFFADVTGDRVRDLCVTSCFGSGMIDTRVQVYDYANKAAYDLSDRGYYDFALSMEGDQLILSKYVYPMEGEPMSVGTLCYENVSDGWRIGMVSRMETVSDEPIVDPQKALTAAILEFNKDGRYMGGDITCASFVTLAELVGDGLEGDEPRAFHTFYGLALYQEFRFADNRLETTGGSHGPVMISFDVDSTGVYRLRDYWEPGDGSDYAADIRNNFPAWTHEDALDTQKFIYSQIQACYAQAVAHGQTNGALDVNRWIEDLLEEDTELSRRELRYLGDYTQVYIFEQFLQGGQTGERGDRLLRAIDFGLEDMERPMLEEEDAQAYFDEWKDYNVMLLQRNSPEFMQEHCPRGYLLLQVMGEVPAELPTDSMAESAAEPRDVFLDLFWELEPASLDAYLADHPEALENGWENLYINAAGLDDGGTSIRTIFDEQVLAIDAQNQVLLLRVEGSGYRGVLAVAKDPTRLSVECSEGLGTYGQTVGEIAERTGAILAMTASGFLDVDTTGNAGNASGGMLDGYMMSNGQSYGEHLVGEGENASYRLELREDDRFYIVDSTTPVDAATTDAIEFRPAMIVDGEVFISELWTSTMPRACIGQSNRGEILMLVVEGRNVLEGILGTDVNTCAAILGQHGSVQAMNLIGGTAAILWYNGESITRCSNPALPDGRALPSIWAYKSRSQ